MIRSPATTIAAATTSAAIESKAATPVISTSSEPDEHADRGQRVGAQVGGVALERRRVVRARLAREDGRDAEVGDHREADHGDADAEPLDLGADDQPVGRLEDDDPGADQDQHPLDRRRQALDLLVAVGVLGVGGLVGLADRDEGDHRGDQVDQRVDRLGEDRDRAGDRPGRELERDQQRVGGDRERRRAAFGADHRRSGAAPRPRCAASMRAARPRWLIACFSAGAQLGHRALVVRAGVVGDEGRVVAEAAAAPRLARPAAPRSAPRRRARRRRRRRGRARRRRRRGGPRRRPRPRAAACRRFSSSLAPSPA